VYICATYWEAPSRSVVRRQPDDSACAPLWASAVLLHYIGCSVLSRLQR
jgi:hypothetical protein